MTDKEITKPPVLTDSQILDILPKIVNPLNPFANRVAQRDDTVGRIVDMMDWKHGKDFITLTELMKLIDNLRQALQKAGEK